MQPEIEALKQLRGKLSGAFAEKQYHLYSKLIRMVSGVYGDMIRREATEGNEATVMEMIADHEADICRIMTAFATDAVAGGLEGYYSLELACAIFDEQGQPMTIPEKVWLMVKQTEH